jgi:hypothetical protein
MKGLDKDAVTYTVDSNCMCHVQGSHQTIAFQCNKLLKIDQQSRGMCFNASHTEVQLNYCPYKKLETLLQREQIPSAQGPVFLSYKDHTKHTNQNKEFSNINL